jgi:hypothetical protein
MKCCPSLRTLGSWFRIPLEVWMLVYVSSLCVVTLRKRPCGGLIPLLKSRTDYLTIYRSLKVAMQRPDLMAHPLHTYINTYILYLSIYLSIYLWLYIPLLSLGRFFSFLILYTVATTPWTGDQPVARPLPTHRTT